MCAVWCAQVGQWKGLIRLSADKNSAEEEARARELLHPKPLMLRHGWLACCLWLCCFALLAPGVAAMRGAAVVSTAVAPVCVALVAVAAAALVEFAPSCRRKSRNAASARRDRAQHCRCQNFRRKRRGDSRGRAH